MSTRISLIAALSERTRAIGKDNDLLWKIPADLKRFKEITSGHPIVMGARTYESIGRALPNRTNIIVSNEPDFSAEGCDVFDSIPAALKRATSLDPDEVFVIGGGMMYAQTIANADRLYLTLIDSPLEGDTYFPEYASLPFAATERTEGAHEGLAYAFVVLDRTL